MQFLKRIFGYVQEEKKVLCIVCGVPYSGKTTFAGYLSKSRGYPVVERDAINVGYALAIVGSQEADKFRSLKKTLGEEQFYKFLESRADELYISAVVSELKSGIGVIADSPFLIPDERSKFLQRVQEQTNVSAEAYWVDADLDTCLQRHREHEARQILWVQNRQIDARAKITENDIKYWHSIKMSPNKEDGFDRVFLVNGTSPEQYRISELH